MLTITERARAYISKMPPAISGSGGNTATFNVVVALVKGFALEEDFAFAILSEWNGQRCSPPWTETELRRKIRSARSSTRPLGYLLHDAAPIQTRSGPAHKSGLDRNAEKRASWPDLRPLTRAESQAIADIRRLDVSAVDLCMRAGFLRAGIVKGHSCFVIGEDWFRQARRYDGEPFVLADGSVIKTYNLPGSSGAFLGAGRLGKSGPVLLIEGSIGLVEAVAACLLADSLDWRVLAATSASSRFHRAPHLLQVLKGRQVRIIPDNDKAGFDAAVAWLPELESAGACVDVLALPTGIKDLGEIVAAPEHHHHLASLFE